MNTTEQPEKQTFREWLKQSFMVKATVIGILVLLLLIPSNLIQDLIRERQARGEEVSAEIADKWSGSQLVQGPVMVLPYKTTVSEKNAAGKYEDRELITNIYLLPEVLNIAASVQPRKLHRAIFDAVVYDAKIHTTGKFDALELQKSDIDPNKILWDKAKVVIGLSDLKGLKNNPVIKLENKPYNVEPDNLSKVFNAAEAATNDIQNLFENNLVIRPDLSVSKSTAINFDFDLDIRGSGDLNFMHLGRTTNVRASGNWNAPSFTGRYLPEERKIAGETFDANWKMTYFNRPFPQQWIGGKTSLQAKGEDAAIFGVKFKLPVDQYQKTMRTAKYAILIILLTFISLLFTELLIKRSIHVLHYALIGSAMTIYYILLLSFSEQMGFNIAYLIASAATIGLISTFIASLLRNKKAAVIYAAIIATFYCFVYVIIQLEDLALLFGSIGLFVIVGVLMHLAARVNLDKK